MLQTQHQKTLKAIWSDNGREFANNEIREFAKQKGIILRYTSPYSPLQNGIVERKQKTLIESAKAMLFEAKAPINYCEFAVQSINTI